MTPERWAEVKALFAAASEQPENEREKFLDDSCGGDAELREEVASLLAASDGEESMPSARKAIGSAALQSVLHTAVGQEYEIIRPLGHGGMGAVYLAREKALERFVAIKVLRPDIAEEQGSRERFRREARIAAQLSHPSIVALHTFGEIGGLWYFVMRYVRGVTLAERLRVEGRLPAGDAQRILMELADALEVAHRHGVVHRDIKPANILLDEDSGHAVLADFGISKIEGTDEHLTMTGMVIGTPSFMSPEQAAGDRDVDERSDIYSLGAVGYTMLAGREPRVAQHAEGSSSASRDTRAALPSLSVVPGVPAELASIVMRCLSPDPAMRFPTARSLRDALSRAAGAKGAAESESLRELPSFGPYAVLWVGFWIVLAAEPGRSLGDRAMLALVALIVPLGLLLHLWNVREPGMEPGELARVAFWPPEWWSMWWPNALRRPTDLWKRLPWPARAMRTVLSAFMLGLPVTVLARKWVDSQTVAPGCCAPWIEGVRQGMILFVALVIVAAFAWALARGLAARDAVRMLFGTTAPSQGWKIPAVAQLLLPAGDSGGAAERDSVAEHRRAIAEAIARNTSLPSDFARQTSAAAGTLLDAIDTADAELARIAHNASAGELERLSGQLDALERGGVGESGELVDLVRRQLEVVRRMRVRAEELSQRKVRMYSQLRGLWRLLDGPSTTERDDQLRAMIGDIARLSSPNS